MKKLIIPFLLIAALAAGCSSQKPSSSSSKPQSSNPSSSKPSTSSSAPQSSSPSSSKPDSSSQTSETKGTVYENKDLGFSFTLPAAIAEHYEAAATEKKDGSEVIKVVTFSLKGESKSEPVFAVKSMSKAEYKALTAKGTKLTELASNDTTVVILEAVKENPFTAGSADAKTFETLSQQLSGIKDSFKLK